jgi:hypothetical protein
MVVIAETAAAMSASQLEAKLGAGQARRLDQDKPVDIGHVRCVEHSVSQKCPPPCTVGLLVQINLKPAGGGSPQGFVLFATPALAHAAMQVQAPGAPLHAPPVPVAAGCSG